MFNKRETTTVKYNIPAKPSAHNSDMDAETIFSMNLICFSMLCIFGH